MATIDRISALRLAYARAKREALAYRLVGAREAEAHWSGKAGRVLASLRRADSRFHPEPVGWTEVQS